MKKHSRKLLILLLCLVCIGVLASGTYAAYTKSVHHKWVVAAQETPSDLRFSSNYLESCDRNSLAYATRLISAGSEAVTIGVTVCNYPQNDLSRVNEATINYALQTSLVNEDGTSASVADVTIQINGSNFGTSLFGTLEGGKASQNLYLITLTAADIAKLGNVYLQIVAMPDESSAAATENKTLAGRLKILPASAQAVGWTGAFTDVPSDTAVLDAFNYELSGTAQGTVTLSWKADKVQLGKWSQELLGGTTSGNSVSFAVGGADQPTKYRLQFYRVGGIPAGETSGVVSSYVSCTFTETAP